MSWLSAIVTDDARTGQATSTMKWPHWNDRINNGRKWWILL